MIHGVIGGPRRKRPVQPKTKRKQRQPIVEEFPEYKDEVKAIIVSSDKETKEMKREELFIEIDYDNIEDLGPNTMEDEMYLLAKEPKPKPKKKPRRKYKKRKKSLL